MSQNDTSNQTPLELKPKQVRVIGTPMGIPMGL